MACILLTLALIICSFKGDNLALAYADSVSLSISGDELYNEAYKILDIVNTERQANGLHPLVMDKDLLQSAMKRSAELSIYFSHSSPCSQSYSTKTSFFYSEGENIAAGQKIAVMGNTGMGYGSDTWTNRHLHFAISTTNSAAEKTADPSKNVENDNSVTVVPDAYYNPNNGAVTFYNPKRVFEVGVSIFE